MKYLFLLLILLVVGCTCPNTTITTPKYSPTKIGDMDRGSFGADIGIYTVEIEGKTYLTTWAGHGWVIGPEIQKKVEKNEISR